jgi:2-iminobutanoate/2-iminopropanoate deaminase
MTARSPVVTPEAPAAIGPYSQAIRHGSLLYCSGMLPLDPHSGETMTTSLAAETDRCLKNLDAICKAAATDLSRAVRLTIYTTRLEGFAEINEAYAAHFPQAPPARAAIGVSSLPKGVRVEIDAIVAIE